jgi:hypothetical protein
MPTGNGYGFAVYSPDAKAITKLFPHPYRFMHQNPHKPHGDGIETPNLVTNIRWKNVGGMTRNRSSTCRSDWTRARSSRP